MWLHTITPISPKYSVGCFCGETFMWTCGRTCNCSRWGRAYCFQEMQQTLYSCFINFYTRPVAICLVFFFFFTQMPWRLKAGKGSRLTLQFHALPFQSGRLFLRSTLAALDIAYLCVFLPYLQEGREVKLIWPWQELRGCYEFISMQNI